MVRFEINAQINCYSFEDDNLDDGQLKITTMYFDDPELTEKQKIGMLKTLIDKLTQWTKIELSDAVLQWRKQN
jgi:cytochrome c oxidase assembly protein Cox11